MKRSTIDFGIDLGTTNSAIAVLQGTEAQVLTNVRGASYTPSAIWLDKRGKLYVGEEARSRSEEDSDNCAIEFKLRMGRGGHGKKVFLRSGREMLPEELSAEVLKSLKTDVKSALGEEIKAAVITVPAAFELPQCDATRRAGELAGFSNCPLLQEPVAAALAYGFQEEQEKLFWLVFDFGGGTFDAAIIQVRDGVIQVVNHAGDNYLGGKLIDWDIVEKLLIPAILEKHELSDFHRGETRWRTAIAKLKAAAEKAKIEVSRKGESVEIWIENLCTDPLGKEIDFEYTLEPETLKEIVQPYGERAINLCLKALSEASLKGEDLSRVLLVGGTTLLPTIREMVSERLSAPLEFSIDPMTVVARGAAIFASTQRLAIEDSAAEGRPVIIELEYDPVGSDDEPPVGGKVRRADGKSLSGHSVELREQKSQWQSGKILLDDDGTFLTTIFAEKGRECIYDIEVTDGQGNTLKTTPTQFSYTIGQVISDIPLPYSIGVAMANNQVDLFFEKGTPLPARHRSIHRAAFAVRAGCSDDKVRIPVVAGENLSRADRNLLAGTLEISGENFSRDVQAGAEVEITLFMDASRMMTAKAFIPVVDEEYEAIIRFDRAPARLPELQQSMSRDVERLTAIRRKAKEEGEERALLAISRIEKEQMEEQVHSLLSAARGDCDAVAECEKRLLDLKAAIDSAEDALEWPTLVDEGREALSEAESYVENFGASGDERRLATLREDLEEAIEKGDPDVLRRQAGEIRTFGLALLTAQPGFWATFLESLEKQREQMSPLDQADLLFSRGKRAAELNDVDALRAIVQQLLNLLPEEVRQVASGFGGTTMV